MALEPEFLLTLADPAQLPSLMKGDFLKGHGEPRLVMVGRSNVGKSSLINALLGKRLARISTQPGKTRAIHFYLWNGFKKIIADFPGYGFAKVSKTERESWNLLIGAYLDSESNLDRALVLLDARHGPTASDLEAIDFLSFRNIPVTLIFTKADTLKTQSLRASRQKEVAEILKGQKVLDRSSPVFWVSSQTGVGMKPLIQFLKSSEE